MDQFKIWNYQPELKEILDLQEHCNQLLEEGVPGNLLKLGKDLWIYNDFREISYAALERSYKALGRDVLLEALNVAREWRVKCDE